MSNSDLLNDILGRSTMQFTPNGNGNGHGPTITVNNDINSINWVAGMSDPGEMIGCGMYQELRRHNGEEDKAYQARITVLLAKLPADVREKIMKVGREAAIKRAGYDLSNGKVNVMVAGGEDPWAAVGTRVSEAVDSMTAERLSGLDFFVEKTAAERTFKGERIVSTKTFMLVRTDTGVELGSVGAGYKVIQNSEGFAFLDAVMGEHGARYATAGSLHGGKKVWMQVEMPVLEYEVVPGDKVQVYVSFVNSHDGTSSAFAFITTKRIVCNNTLRLAIRDNDKNEGKGIKIRHTGDIKAKVADAQVALGLAKTKAEEFKGVTETLVATKLASPLTYFGDVLDACLDITQAQMEKGAQALANEDVLAGIIKTDEAKRKAELAYQRAIDNRVSVLDDIVARWQSERCQVGGIGNTAWGAMNAVTESADHGKLGQPGRRIGTSEAQASRRLESIVSGEIDDMKQVALQQALALAN